MRSCILILVLALIYTSCDKNKCECIDEIRFNWLEGERFSGFDVQVPNGVINDGHPFAIRISSVTVPAVSWEANSIKMFDGDHVYLDTKETDDFVINNSTIRVPHEIFDSQSGNIRGPVSIEITVSFPEKGSILLIDGSIYYYDCEDIQDEFNRVECRWPSSILFPGLFVEHC